jgi:hypothetical protein
MAWFALCQFISSPSRHGLQEGRPVYETRELLARQAAIPDADRHAAARKALVTQSAALSVRNVNAAVTVTGGWLWRDVRRIELNPNPKPPARARVQAHIWSRAGVPALASMASHLATSEPSANQMGAVTSLTMEADLVRMKKSSLMPGSCHCLIAGW